MEAIIASVTATLKHKKMIMEGVQNNVNELSLQLSIEAEDLKVRKAEVDQLESELERLQEITDGPLAVSNIEKLRRVDPVYRLGAGKAPIL